MTTCEYAVVTTTHDAEDKAHALAAAVIEGRLAACAQIYPVTSVYRWRGRVAGGREWRVDFKTRGDLVAELTALIRERHDYDTPEIVAVPVLSGSPEYLTWITDETGS
ncbi:divalent-cation tolerance protein CutA [Streptomyces sp. TG1A-8]|uniref:divalent-cation tolerance protein CutA n=1 Tax=Streptomyces sp. TG1A-8 TaxID=3051385 RepID=UPI00265B7D78|nr:divalent-cation tolerance protein CutA [Streptomyces sp. TG1A-8]MDO0928016.1 divalent-cation tolerance protein CutA [Streptomyces sp. TG1A-8]